MSIPVAKQYIKDFEQLGFGIFVHFGLYSILERGEWIAERTKAKREDYQQLMKEFKVDTMEEIVKVAKSAGAKYVTLTTRHHDGFSLYDTKGLTDYDAPHALAGRDLIKEFVEACRKYDIVPFFYHTTLEFFNDDFDNNFEKYLEYLRKSVEILCTNYGKIGGLWFDGNWSKKSENGEDIWHESELYATIRKHQPDAMIINNTGMRARGKLGHPEIDSLTFERGNPMPINREGMEKYLTGEVCDTSNTHWGIAVKDFDMKSPAYIIETLCKARRAGANYLFNVGPDKGGHVEPYSTATLEIVGKWMNIFGKAVYDGRPLWANDEKKNFVLKSEKENKAYFFCYNISQKGPKDVVHNKGLDGDYLYENLNLKVKSVKWMDDGEVLSFRQEKEGFVLGITGYDYGYNYVVRVAEAELEK